MTAAVRRFLALDGGVRQIVYGLVCNLNGLAFSDGEAVEILPGVNF